MKKYLRLLAALFAFACLLPAGLVAASPGSSGQGRVPVPRATRVPVRTIAPIKRVPTRRLGRQTTLRRVPRPARPPRLMSTRQARTFMRQVARREARFLRPGVGYDDATGMTYDGHDIDIATGELRAGGPNNRSAASKESLHLIVLYKAIAGDETAQRLISPDAPERAAEIALQVLDRKIRSYRDFDRRHPGFGGFLPWYRIEGGRVEPLADWTSRVPGLDNGQLAWSLYVVARGLRQHGHRALARRYEQHLERMGRNVVRIFYDPSRRLMRGEARLGRGSSVAPGRNRYETQGYHIDDPFEGDLLYHFADLFGDWRGHAGGRDAMWQRPARRQPAVFDDGNGPITVSKGHWHSSHEQWGFAVLPYVDVEAARTIFDNEQRMRTIHAARRGEWLKASAHVPQRDNAPIAYLNALGIGDQGVTIDRVEPNDVYAPYATFPLALAEGHDPGGHDHARRVFATWLRTMVRAPRMWGPYGMGESFNGSGDAIAPTLTWDGKILPLVAWMGGIVAETRQYLAAEGRYQRFVEHVRSDYAHFEGRPIEGTQRPLEPPSRNVPRGMRGFPRPR